MLRITRELWMQASELLRMTKQFVFIRGFSRKILLATFVSFVQFVVFIVLVVVEVSQKALLHHVLMLGITVVGEGLDGNATTGIKQADDLQIFGVHQLDQVFHDDVHAVFVEVAVVAETEEVEFQALALHHQRARNVINNNVSEVGLARLGAK